MMLHIMLLAVGLLHSLVLAFPSTFAIGLSKNQKQRSIFALSYNNRLENVSSLQNEYFALRHGQSLANVEKIIASSPEIACKYGLSVAGKEQALKAGETVVHQLQNQKYSGVLILSSDLLRAKQTAEAVAEAVRMSSTPLHTDGVILDTRLRERGFGEWDGGSDNNYNEVWKDDATDPNHEVQGVESVMSVMDRATTCIREWDAEFEDYMVICVAHGDVLQILQTAFCKMDGSKHRTLEHLETATLRRLPLASEVP